MQTCGEENLYPSLSSRISPGADGAKQSGTHVAFRGRCVLGLCIWKGTWVHTYKSFPMSFFPIDSATGYADNEDLQACLEVMVAFCFGAPLFIRKKISL